MIDPQAAWLLIRQNALKALKAKMQWHSLVQGKEYRIIKVLEDRIIIKRQGDANSEELTRVRVTEAAHFFNANNFKVERGSLISPTVAQETAFVLLHPHLTWDDEKKFIIQQ